MDVEAKRPPMSEVWTRLEGQVVNGEFPLRRYLGSSDHSGVFLTEYASQNLSQAALKLVPAIPTLAESQLTHWRAAAGVAHPQLIRLFETGRCQLGGLHYLYAIMGYAEQNLGQLLLHRALSENEVREMLPLILESLGFLHSRNLVQGQLKPSNILVIDNQLKLASDTIRPAGEATASIGTLSVYNPPEARDGSFSTSGDIWALGVTLCQALTQRAPSRSGERGESVVLPTDFPVAFIDIVRRCLSRNPAQRPSVAAFGEWLKRGTLEPTVVAEPAVTASPPAAAVVTKPRNDGATRLVIRAVLSSEPEPAPVPPPERRSFVVPIVVVIAVLALGWVGVRWFTGRPGPGAGSTAAVSTDAAGTPASASGALEGASGPGGAESAQSAGGTPPAAPGAAGSSGVAATTGASAKPSTSPAAGPASAAPAAAPSNRTSARASSSDPDVLHEEIPNVSLHSRETIHGHVKVIVRVTVDKSGAVVSDVLENPGPSKYFARLAGEAASKWKFAPADHQPTRQWLIRFEFSRDGTGALAARRSP